MPAVPCHSGAHAGHGLPPRPVDRASCPPSALSSAPSQNLALRIILRTRVASYLLFVLTLVLTFYANIEACSSVLLVWLGLGPMQVRKCCLVLLHCIYACVRGCARGILAKNRFLARLRPTVQ